jgi:hypothetical protein
MPGRVASTVARPLSGDRYIPRPNLPANPVVDPLADSFPPRSRIDHEEDRKHGLSSRATKQMLNIGDHLKLIQITLTRERSVVSPA